MRILVTLVITILAMLLSIAMPPPASAGIAPKSTPEISVGIVLFDGVQIIDFAGPYEVFGTAGFGVVTISRDGGPVTTEMGLNVTPDHDFASAPAFDVLLVPGGNTNDAQKDTALLDFIRARTEAGRLVLSVCTGAHVLGAAGLLDGLMATTFMGALDSLKLLYPGIDVVRDVRWTDNGKIITSAGLSSGIDAALHVVDRLRGTDVARSTALHLEYDWNPDGGFVRTKMADRYMPGLRNVVFPEGTRFNRTVSVGDEQRWRIHYEVTSPIEQESLMQLIVEGVNSTDGWTRTSADAYRWHATMEDRSVVLSFATQASDTEGTFALEVTLDTQAAAR